MNQEVKERWLDRLENGDILQATAHLGDTEGGRCCLGVLCDIAVEEGVIGAPTVVNDSLLQYDDQVAVLPTVVMKWAGIDTPNGGYFSIDALSEDYNDALSFQNDCGKTFPEIAQIIREKF